MNVRVVLWATAGLLIAGFWALYLFPAGATFSPMVMLARVSCPVVNLPVALRFYWVMLGNAVVYGIVGMVVESLKIPTQAKEA